MESIGLTKGNFIKIKDSEHHIKLMWTDLAQGIALDCDPIPLTEEWLLKFDIDARNLCGGILHKISKGYNFIHQGHLLSRLEYVHELQNLYYALNKTELILK